MASGYSDEIAAVERGSEKFTAFLKKPFDMPTLRAALGPLLG